MGTPIIHIGVMQEKGAKVRLFLRCLEPYRYVWFKGDVETAIWGGSPQEAIEAARKEWALDHFRTINCGFRYTLPERDEHGVNALYSQMAASYNSMNGVYFDPDLSCNCFVQNASLEARDILREFS